MAMNMNLQTVQSRTLTAYQSPLYYDTTQNAALYNRMGQYYYRCGKVDKAKTLFFLAKLYDGTFQVDPSLIPQDRDFQ